MGQDKRFYLVVAGVLGFGCGRPPQVGDPCTDDILRGVCADQNTVLICGRGFVGELIPCGGGCIDRLEGANCNQTKAASGERCLIGSDCSTDPMGTKLHCEGTVYDRYWRVIQPNSAGEAECLDEHESWPDVPRGGGK